MSNDQKSKLTMEIKVNTSELDNALEKATHLLRLLEEVKAIMSSLGTNNIINTFITNSTSDDQ
ncbi:hypothetical protein [Vallitalea guaymasensis]|uniref:hypothetical protein n=1 Tax=Vallitalea guaymasensis TaxID=1185412 RepID=UPI000DE5420D|nr:hypothetical protein [Vallitalea guaymasensis]